MIVFFRFFFFSRFNRTFSVFQYLLSWNNFHGNMCKGFHNLQKDEKMVDVTIAAGGKIFKAHKLVSLSKTISINKYENHTNRILIS